MEIFSYEICYSGLEYYDDSFITMYGKVISYILYSNLQITGVHMLVSVLNVSLRSNFYFCISKFQLLGFNKSKTFCYKVRDKGDMVPFLSNLVLQTTFKFLNIPVNFLFHNAYRYYIITSQLKNKMFDDVCLL